MAGLLLSLFYYWFAVADRYLVFLYYHDMGPLAPDTSPFSEVTGSRYWMAGLVANGIAMVLYPGASWTLGRLSSRYEPPAWRPVWAAGGIPLLVGIPLITMTVNEPKLPASYAGAVTLVAILGLGLALLPGKMAARRPWDLLLLAADGWAMAGLLLAVSFAQRAGWMLKRGASWPLVVVGLGAVGAIGMLLLLTGIRLWRRSLPPAAALFAAGLATAYLLLPAIHHLGFTGGYYYISTGDNFFAGEWKMQSLAWFVTALVALGITQLRKQLARWWALRKSAA
jgi:hypothetical protein